MNPLRFQRLCPHHEVLPLLRLYRRAVGRIDNHLYSQSEINAWLAWADNEAKAEVLVRRGITILALRNAEVAGFGQLYPGDRINMLYVDPAWGRTGIGSALIRILEQIARRQGQHRLSARASHVSRPLFAAAGFSRVTADSITAARDLDLQVTGMAKTLSDQGRREGPLQRSTASSVDDNGSADRLVITQLGHKQHLC